MSGGGGGGANFAYCVCVHYHFLLNANFILKVHQVIIPDEQVMLVNGDTPRHKSLPVDQPN